MFTVPPSLSQAYGNSDSAPPPEPELYNPERREVREYSLKTTSFAKFMHLDKFSLSLGSFSILFIAFKPRPSVQPGRLS